jgi:glycosyltransferase
MKSAPYTTRLITGSCSGVYQALNEGINQASGDYIAILHASDSLYSPTCLAKALEQLQATDADIFFADLHFVNKAGRRIRYYSGARFRPDSLRDGFMFPHPTMVVKRTKALEVGPYNPEYAIAGDFEWIVRAVLIHRLSTTYLKIDMVEMTTGGISTKWRNRLYFTAREKYISLKSNGIKVSPLRLLRRYIYLFNR